jgi:beta-lactamase class D
VEGLIPSFTFIEITFCENEKEGSKNVIPKKIKNRFTNSSFINIFLSFGCIRVIYEKRSYKQKEVTVQLRQAIKQQITSNSFFLIFPALFKSSVDSYSDSEKDLKYFYKKIRFKIFKPDLSKNEAGKNVCPLKFFL